MKILYQVKPGKPAPQCLGNKHLHMGPIAIGNGIVKRSGAVLSNSLGIHSPTGNGFPTFS